LVYIINYVVIDRKKQPKQLFIDMETTLLYLVSIVIILMLMIIISLSFDRDTKEEECGCTTCECGELFDQNKPFIIEDDGIPMLDRPLTKKEVKEMNMEEQNKEYNIMTARDMMTMKTEVGQTASPENITKTHRGVSYKNEPLEENDPNPNKK